MSIVGKIGLAMALSVASVAPERADEQTHRQGTDATVRWLLGERDFTGLNSAMTMMRGPDYVGPNGTPVLPLYYQAVEGYLVDQRQGKTCSTPTMRIIDDWNTATPHAPAAIISKSMALMNQAWCIRGNDFADKVNPTAWPKFHALVAEAEKNLTKNKSDAAIDPQWYVEMQGVALSDGWSDEQATALFNEASGKFPKYLDIYYEQMDRLLPQWYGSLQKMENFAASQSQKTQKALGDRLYAKLYWHVFDNMPVDDLRRKTQINWPHMRRSMESIASAYPDAWNITKLARISCLSYDGHETKLFLSKIGWKYDQKYWRSKGEFEGCSILAKFSI